jgi:prepilin peptidase CpaA
MTFAQLVLSSVLFFASMTDLRSRRIPNALIAIGLCAALAGGALGLTALSLSECLIGALVGLGLFLPLYVFRAVGAGDAKLMSVIGALVGGSAVVSVCVYTALAGFAMAVLMLVRHGGWRRTCSDMIFLIHHAILRLSGQKLVVADLARTSSVRLPYAVAITAGVVVWWLRGDVFF